jgi:hypothetical protein
MLRASRGRSNLYRLLFASVLFLSAETSYGDSLPINTEVLKKSVVFLYDLDPNLVINQSKMKVATGILVGIPSKDLPGQHYLAIVTARHVVEPTWAGCLGPNPQALYIRVNLKDYVPQGGKTGIWQGKIDLFFNGKPIWMVNKDDRVDAAVIPVLDPRAVEDNDVKYISISDFGTKEELAKFKVGVGDQIISDGLVASFSLESRIYPAFKFGRISSVMDEPIQESRCGPGSASKFTWSWLIAGNFVAGNSGSPIYLLPLDFTLGPALQYNGPRPMLIGLLAATIDGADLAEMVPIEYVFEIIQQNYPMGDLYRGDSKNKPKPAT